MIVTECVHNYDIIIKNMHMPATLNYISTSWVQCNIRFGMAIYVSCHDWLSSKESEIHAPSVIALSFNDVNGALSSLVFIIKAHKMIFYKCVSSY